MPIARLMQTHRQLRCSWLGAVRAVAEHGRADRTPSPAGKRSPPRKGWVTPCRSPAIVGSAVATIVWSSAARNLPSMRRPEDHQDPLVRGPAHLVGFGDGHRGGTFRHEVPQVPVDVAGDLAEQPRELGLLGLGPAGQKPGEPGPAGGQEPPDRSSCWALRVTAGASTRLLGQINQLVSQIWTQRTGERPRCSSPPSAAGRSVTMSIMPAGSLANPASAPWRAWWTARPAAELPEGRTGR